MWTLGRRGYNQKRSCKGPEAGECCACAKGQEEALGLAQHGQGEGTGRWDQRGQVGNLVGHSFYVECDGCQELCRSGMLPFLQANKRACCFMDEGRRHETLGPQANMAKQQPGLHIGCVQFSVPFESHRGDTRSIMGICTCSRLCYRRRTKAKSSTLSEQAANIRNSRHASLSPHGKGSFLDCHT